MKEVNVTREDLRSMRWAGVIFKTLERAERFVEGDESLEILETYCDGEFVGYAVNGREGYQF